MEWYSKKKPKGITEAVDVTLSGYDLDESNAKKIDAYIQKHQESKLNKTYPLKLRGVREDLPVYSLPLDLLFYNIRNGRFAMEYGALKAKEGHELRTEDSADAKKIQNLLLDIDPKHTLYLVNDIKKMRQTEPGVITIGGYVLNGNRRMAVLQNLVEQGDSSFGYLEVARLPGKVSPIDVWKIEAGIQLSREKQLDYDPINVLLKFEEGLNSGLSSMEMAKSLYGGFKEKDIVEKLQQLKLIVQYLRFIECPKQFHRVKGLDTHFIEIRKNVLNAEKRGLSPAEITDIKLIGFQLIFDGTSHKDLRKIDKIVADEEIKEEFWKALDYSKAESLAKKAQVRKDSEDKDALTPAREIFTECVDFVKIKTEKKQPTKLLKNALKNLKNIERKKSSFASPESITLIGDIAQVAKKLNAIAEGAGK